MKMVGLMVLITRSICSAGKVVIMYSGLFLLKGLSEMSKRGVYGSVLIKIGPIGLGGFMETVLNITSGQTIMAMRDIILVNEMIQSLMFLI